MINILILEDNTILLDELELLIKTSSELKSLRKEINVVKCDSFYRGLELIRSSIFNIFMLDIDLGTKATGYDFAKEIRNIEHYKLSHIIFLTGDVTKELSAYKNIHAYSYLSKPYSRNELIDILYTLIKHEKTETKQEKLIINVDGIKRLINLHDIICVEAKGRGCRIVTVFENLDANYNSLKDVSKTLFSSQSLSFVQCHKSFIISSSYVESVSKGNDFVNMEHLPFSVPMGKKYRESCLHILNSNLKGYE